MVQVYDNMRVILYIYIILANFSKSLCCSRVDCKNTFCMESGFYNSAIMLFVNKSQSCKHWLLACWATKLLENWFLEARSAKSAWIMIIFWFGLFKWYNFQPCEYVWICCILELCEKLGLGVAECSFASMCEFTQLIICLILCIFGHFGQNLTLLVSDETGK